MLTEMSLEIIFPFCLIKMLLGINLEWIFFFILFLAHGTFIGTIRLEPQKPTQVQVDSVIRFGASSRSYVLREKPTMPSSALKLPENASDNVEQDNDENTKGGLLGLPESDTELDVRVMNL